MKIKMQFWLMFSALIFGILSSYSQEVDSCKVLINEISGSYKGGCKDGLAHGKGIAIGADKYIGEFKNGMPDGKGKYTYKDGNTFAGYWVKGIKNGKGKFTYFAGGKSNMLSGYWKDGEYAGITNPDELYRVTNQTGIENYTIKKVDDSETKITISLIAAMQKYVPRDLKINISSGFLNQKIKDFTITQYSCPVNCEIHFTIRTSGGNKECFLYFDVLKPGNYEVLINNN